VLIASFLGEGAGVYSRDGGSSSYFFLEGGFVLVLALKILLMKRTGLILWLCRDCGSEDWVGND